MPSIVVTSASSAWTARTVQLFTASPLRWTVQAPQFDVSQPTCVPVSPSVSRRKCTNSCRGSTSPACSCPLTVTVIGTRPAISDPPQPSGTTSSLRNLHPDSHRKSTRWAERRRLADPEAEAGLQLDAEPLADGGRDGADLGLAEAHPEADPGAAAERDVGALGNPLASLGCEAFGAERVRLLPYAGQPVRGPRGVVDRRALGDVVAAEVERARSAPRPDPGRRVEAQRLLERLLEQLRVAGHVDLGVAGELVEQEGDRRGGGVVAGEQQRHHVVADVAVAERGVEQQRQHVLAAAPAPAAPGYLGVDQAVGPLARGLPRRPPRARGAEHLGPR